MIINTGQRTDIPAFYARWFLNWIRAGSVCVRNPYNPSQVSRYRLSPKVVDCIGFCTKNPLPLLPYLDQLQGYGQYWYVSITPYGRDLEPNVPDKHRLLQAFRQLSREVGKQAIGWRYDPILLTERYTTEYHLRAFRTMAETLAGFTDTVVISFVDCYPKVLQNFPELQTVPEAVRLQLGKELIGIAARYGMQLRTCAEGDQLSREVGKQAIGWRYDPILLTERYTTEYHLRAFRTMAETLAGFTDTVVISFVDCYPKVLQNFPELQTVPEAVRLQLGKELIGIAARYGMQLRTCAEGDQLAPYGADCSGCMKLSDYERAIGKKLHAPKVKGARAECACYLSCDIGAYSTCRHFCRYCYANGARQEVLVRSRQHDPASPFLIGNYEEGDQIHDVPQKSWVEPEMSLFP